MSCVVLKVEFEKELRRVSVDRAISFENLKQKLANMFSLADTARFSLSHRDNDNLIKIESEEACQMALQTASKKSPAVLRLIIEKDTKGKGLGVVCSNCKTACGTSSYFKCLNCLSYELCDACAAEDCHMDHMLVKLRQPVDSLPYKQQLVFLRHITDPAEKALAKKRRRALREERTKKEVQRESCIVEPASLPEVDANASKGERNMNVSLLMSEFQEVANEGAKAEEPSIDKEMAAWDTAVIETAPESTKEDFPQENETVALPPAINEEKREEKDEKPNPFKANLDALEQMGFCDREKNIQLLVKHVNDLEAAVEELLHTKTSWFDFARFGL